MLVGVLLNSIPDYVLLLINKLENFPCLTISLTQYNIILIAQDLYWQTFLLKKPLPVRLYVTDGVGGWLWHIYVRDMRMDAPI